MPGRLVYRVHAVIRMFQRSIVESEVGAVVEKGEVVERYPDDQPYPSRLMLGRPGNRPLHVVAADNAKDGETVVITVYEPDPAQWDETFRRRRDP